MIYVLETTTTGSGLDIYFRRSRSGTSVLVTNDPQRYAKDINRDQIAKMKTISHAAFDLAVETGDWPFGMPTLVTSNSDAYLRKAAAVSKQLCLPAPAVKDLDLCMQKDRFRAVQKALGLPCPYFEAVAVSGFVPPSSASYPLVCKPVVGTGSIGVKLCRTPDDLSAWVVELEEITSCAHVLLEEYIQGPLYSVEAVLQPNARPHIIGFTNRDLGPPPFFVETMYTFPVHLSDEVVGAVRIALARLSTKLHAATMAHMEFVIDARANRPVMIELNPRVGGGMLSRMISEACGTNIFDTYLSVWQQDIPATLPCSHSKALSHGWKYPAFGGVIADRLVHFDTEHNDNVLEFSWCVQNGDRVDVSKDFKGPICSLLVGADNSQLSADMWRSVSNAIDVAIKT